MLNAEFNDLAMNPALDLYPADLAEKIEETEGWLHDCVTDGPFLPCVAAAGCLLWCLSDLD